MEEARNFKLEIIPLLPFMKFSSEIRQPAEKDGKNPKRLFFGKRDVPS